jgi:hypothetical protein
MERLKIIYTPSAARSDHLLERVISHTQTHQAKHPLPTFPFPQSARSSCYIFLIHRLLDFLAPAFEQSRRCTPKVKARSRTFRLAFRQIAAVDVAAARGRGRSEGEECESDGRESGEEVHCGVEDVDSES